MQRNNLLLLSLSLLVLLPLTARIRPRTIPPPPASPAPGTIRETSGVPVIVDRVENGWVCLEDENLLHLWVPLSHFGTQVSEGSVFRLLLKPDPQLTATRRCRVSHLQQTMINSDSDRTMINQRVAPSDKRFDNAKCLPSLSPSQLRSPSNPGHSNPSHRTAPR